MSKHNYIFQSFISCSKLEPPSDSLDRCSEWPWLLRYCTFKGCVDVGKIS